MHGINELSHSATSPLFRDVRWYISVAKCSRFQLVIPAGEAGCVTRNSLNAFKDKITPSGVAKLQYQG
ncbi:hypothetical protein GBAG_3534 [Buttiauxella agrestis ATCC 33320]|uniref:Uncharacterized protein n=1 Tax=Buttiauxella agrestis ATCC 33320 TaxID=1006004 RepID=A0A085G2D2_9ENTR|nr:hypothetical protein GBAG_3534 [Buttiauxella agrestis ATCC 33320]